MAKKLNKKKIVSICPVGILKTKCPSIRRTRHIRVRLLTLQREKKVDAERIVKLRSQLKEVKKQGIAVSCKTCSFNTSESTPASAPQ